MQDLLLTDEGGVWDLLLVNNDLVVISDADALIQKIAIKLKFFFAEWYLDTSVGIKYFESILIKNPDLNLIENIYKAAILDEPEIISLVEFQVDYDNQLRKLDVTWRADSIYGEVQSTEVFTI